MKAALLDSQGDVLSLILFNIVTDPLFDFLSSGGFGLRVEGMRMARLAYADDLALVSGSLGGLQNIIDRCL